MNAYELAEIMTVHDESRIWEHGLEIANMLRQQADRIAELENEVKRLVGAEPITYGRLTFCKNCGQQDPYTQTKPLTDEEIIAIRDSCYVQSGIDEWEFDDVNFARAIEERHGIK